MENRKERISNLFNKLGNYILIIAMLIIGFFIGKYSNTINPREDQIMKSLSEKEISIAINESNDLLIIDKKSGKYEIFSDSVGLTIFRMYAGKISQTNLTNN